MVILVMGVSGVGKTVAGQELAAQLGWTFLDADDDHTADNIARMQAGLPLSDELRTPWLAAVRNRVQRHVSRGENVVLACSALKESYRHFLSDVATETAIVLLDAPADVVAQRLAQREGHFMNPVLLESQERTLEEPATGIAIDAARPIVEVVASIRQRLGV